jgi:hypothetical protein
MKEKQYVILRYWADAGIIYRDVKLADGTVLRQEKERGGWRWKDVSMDNNKEMK